MTRLLLALLLAVVASGARAATLERAMLLDPTHRLTLTEAMGGDAGFQPMPPGDVNLGFTDDAVWIALRPQGLDAGQRWMLALSHAVLDRVDAHVVAGDGSIVSHALGDLRPHDRRPYPHRKFVVPVPTDTRAIYLHIVSQGSVALPMDLVSEATLLDTDRLELALFGFYFGVLIAMAAYNACICVVVRDASYVYYVLYVLAFGALQAQLNGFAAPLLPLAGLDANKVLLLLYGGTITGGLLFVQNLIDTRNLMPGWHRVLQALALAGAAGGLGGLALPYSPMIKFLLAIGALTLVSIMAAVPVAIARGSKPARFLALAFLALLPGCALFVLRTIGVLPHNLLTQHGLELSTALETVVLSFALANRINTWRAEAAAAEVAVARAHARYSRQLARAMEDDRRRIAAELHDSVGQSLLVLSNGLKRAFGAGGDARAAEMVELARQSVADVRAVAQDLHPAQVERLGLADALKGMLARAFADAPASLHIDVDIDELAPHSMRDVQLFRIAQEAAANVLRHADARHCWVRLAQNGEGLALTVEDDGRGLPADSGNGSGLGLSTQRERAALIGADYTLTDRPGGGTRLAVIAPLEPTT